MSKLSDYRVPWMRALSLFLILFAAVQLISLMVLRLNKKAAHAPSEVVRNSRLHLNLYPAPSFEESVIYWQTYAALNWAEAPDTLFIGDSACLMGIMPNVISERAGLKTWNLGTVATMYTDGQADLLQLYLSRGQKPRRVVFIFSGVMAGLTRSGIHEAGVLNKWESWLWNRESRNGGLFAWLPGSRLKNRIEAAYTDWEFAHNRDTLLNAKREGYDSDHEIEMGLRDERGYTEEKVSIPLPEHDAISNPVLSPSAVPGLQRIFKIASSQGIETIVMLNPLPEKYNTEDTKSSVAGLLRSLQTIAGNFPKSRVNSPFLEFYPTELYKTGAHFNRAGAQRHSEAVADWLKVELGAEVPPISRRDTASVR